MREAVERGLERRLAVHEERLAALRAHLDEIERATREIDAVIPEVGRESAPRSKMDPSFRLPVPELERRRELIADEIAAHETLLALARDPTTIEALNDVLERPDVAAEAAEDPRGFARSRGVELPRNMGVQVRVVGGRTTVLIGYLREGFTVVLELGGEEA